jgi:hypothetical protein
METNIKGKQPKCSSRVTPLVQPLSCVIALSIVVSVTPAVHAQTVFNTSAAPRGLTNLAPPSQMSDAFLGQDKKGPYVLSYRNFLFGPGQPVWVTVDNVPQRTAAYVLDTATGEVSPGRAVVEYDTSLLDLQQPIDMVVPDCCLHGTCRRCKPYKSVRQDAGQVDQDEEEDKLCCVCMVGDANVELPCHHKLCGVCRPRLARCPLCRKDVPRIEVVAARPAPPTPIIVRMPDNELDQIAPGGFDPNWHGQTMTIVRRYDCPCYRNIPRASDIHHFTVQAHYATRGNRFLLHRMMESEFAGLNGDCCHRYFDRVIRTGVSTFEICMGCEEQTVRDPFDPFDD